ncbi:MAG: hypothetical protein IK062_04200 [Selenomonadaceae bacterium]|nr:hypothetical protein [Selenomonadaceae bacterium]
MTGSGDDYVYNYRSNTSVELGDENDTIDNSDGRATIDGGTGNDFIRNDYGDGSVVASGGDGNDITPTIKITKNCEKFLADVKCE